MCRFLDVKMEGRGLGRVVEGNESSMVKNP